MYIPHANIVSNETILRQNKKEELVFEAKQPDFWHSPLIQMAYWKSLCKI